MRLEFEDSKESHIRIVYLLGILTLLAMGCMSKETLEPAPTPVPTHLTDSAKLERFIKRMFSHSMRPGSQANGEPQIFLGEMPSDFDVQVPEDADIIGSLVQGDKSFQAIVDTPMDQGEAAKFYSEALATAGWLEQPRHEQGGFTSASEGVSLGFCSNENFVLYLTLSDSPVENLTEVRLRTTNFSGFPRSPCDQDEGMGRSEARLTLVGDILPTLGSPAGARSTGGSYSSASMGFSDKSVRSETTLNTGLSAVELEEHYRKQLEDLDWKLVEKGAEGPMAISTWRLTDEKGNERWGLLWVVEGPEEDRRTAVIQVTLPGR